MSIGPTDLTLYETPRPDLLEAITGVKPEGAGTHVMLESFGIRSTQRLLLSEVGKSLVVAFWPAELKSQAEFLYSDGRGRAMVESALGLGWKVWATPQLAFFNSRPSQRLYMQPDTDPAEYATRWEESDRHWIGQHPGDELRKRVWPWLKERRYVSDGDDSVLEQFLRILGRRKAHLRPALRFHGRLDPEELGRPVQVVADAIRREFNAVLRAAGEPVLTR